MNGTLATMNLRHTVSNDPVQPVNGTEAGSAYPHVNSGRIHTMAQNGSTPASTRPPTSAGVAGVTAESSQEDSEPDKIRRRPTPLLQRSKSDFGPRGEDIDTNMEDDVQDWGERHGFGTNYASEEYVSQLANVSLSHSFLYSWYLDRTSTFYAFEHAFSYHSTNLRHKQTVYSIEYFFIKACKIILTLGV